MPVTTSRVFGDVTSMKLFTFSPMYVVSIINLFAVTHSSHAAAASDVSKTTFTYPSRGTDVGSVGSYAVPFYVKLETVPKKVLIRPYSPGM